MCGRFSLAILWEQLMEYFQLESMSFEYMPRYNIAPGQLIPVLVARNGKLHAGQLRWGLIPSWAKDEKIGYQTINAKAETLSDKPSFASAFERRRCIIPADGFFEWKKNGASKQPYRITLKSGEPLAMAGLYDTWTTPDGNQISSCTIITTEPNSLIADLHNRMPAILRHEDIPQWLDRTQFNRQQLQALLTPYPAEKMQAYAVSPKVGSVKNDTPDLIEPYVEQGSFLL